MRSSSPEGTASVPVASSPPSAQPGRGFASLSGCPSLSRSLLLFGFVLWGAGWLPLLGGPRYEAALLAGLLGPAWAGIFLGRHVQCRLTQLRRQCREDGLPRALSGAQLFGEGLLFGALHGLVPILVATVHGWTQGFCEPVLGYLLLLLGPGVGCLLGAALGVGIAVGSQCFSRDAPSRWWIVLVPLVIFMSACASLWQFYSSPGVRLLDLFAGYFAGPVYDPVDYRLSELWNFRSVALLLLAGAGTLLASGTASVRTRVAWARRAELPSIKWSAMSLGVLFLFSGGLLMLNSDRLGWSTSDQALRAQLGGVVRKEHCIVYYPSAVSAQAARTVAWECEGHLVQHARYFATAIPQQVTVYLFATTEQKKELMGAGVTNVAKPWRREVYISDQGFPHPILGHELAHVVTAAFGRGPFRVAGMLGGWVMDPGRVEGFAEAAAPREASPGTLREWAAAMKQVDRLPPLQALFQLGFFGTSAARSYTAAGAFVDFIHRHHGPRTLKAWYGGAELPSLTFQSWTAMEREWFDELDATQVPEAILELARPRFSRPGVFEQRCPHAVDRRLSEFFLACEATPEKAPQLAAEIRHLDPSRVDLSLELPRCEAAAGQHERAIHALESELGSETAYEAEERRRALLLLGDLLFGQGRGAEARHRYESALSLTFSPHEQRQLELRLWSLEQKGELRELLRRFLAGPRSQSTMRQGLLAVWLADGGDWGHRDLARYLALRQAVVLREWPEARHWADRLQPERLPLESLRKEAARMALLMACYEAQGTLDSFASQRQMSENDEDARAEVKKALNEWLAYRSSAADEEHASRWAERCMEGLR